MNRRFATNPALLTLLPLAALAGCSDAPEAEGSGNGIEMFSGPGATAPAPNSNGSPPAPSPTPTPSGGTSTGETTPTPNLATPPANGQNGTTPPAGTTPPTPPVTVPPATDPNAPPATQPPAASGAPSAGCALAAAAPANANVANTIVTFPTGYDGSTPVPLLFAFHGAGRTNTDMRMVDSRTNGGALENTYVVAYMKSAGNAWDLNTDYPRFEAALEQMLGQFCIDTGNLFAMGHSSGAQFIASMLANRAERRFAGVAPVSSNRVGTWSPVPAMLIHGLMDTARPNDLSGAIDITQYTESNQCSGGTTPVNVPSCTSLAMGATVNAGCVQYNGCAAPTFFCNHNDPNYLDNGTPTNHGWPCFANSEILRFFESLR